MKKLKAVSWFKNDWGLLLGDWALWDGVLFSSFRESDVVRWCIVVIMHKMGVLGCSSALCSTVLLGCVRPFFKSALVTESSCLVFGLRVQAYGSIPLTCGCSIPSLISATHSKAIIMGINYCDQFEFQLPLLCQQVSTMCLHTQHICTTHTTHLPPHTHKWSCHSYRLKRANSTPELQELAPGLLLLTPSTPKVKVLFLEKE